MRLLHRVYVCLLRLFCLFPHFAFDVVDFTRLRLFYRCCYVWFTFVVVYVDLRSFTRLFYVHVTLFTRLIVTFDSTLLFPLRLRYDYVLPFVALLRYRLHILHSTFTFSLRLHVVALPAGLLFDSHRLRVHVVVPFLICSLRYRYVYRLRSHVLHVYWLRC